MVREDSPGVGNGHLLRYSCLETSTARRHWWATVQGVAKNRTRLSENTRTQSLSPGRQPHCGSACETCTFHILADGPSAEAGLAAKPCVNAGPFTRAWILGAAFSGAGMGVTVTDALQAWWDTISLSLFFLFCLKSIFLFLPG